MKITAKGYQWLLPACLLFTNQLVALDDQALLASHEALTQKPSSSEYKTASSSEALESQGWSFEVGGQYTWMSFSSPPTFTGSTGGALAKLTYQTPTAFFGQLRTVYNAGTLSSDVNQADESEWYGEFVGGYCFSIFQGMTITPYVGMGFDFLTDSRDSYGSISAIELKYQIYYALAGLDIHYSWDRWSVGAQIDCFPTYNEYLNVVGLPGAAWKMDNKVGAAVRLPAAYKMTKHTWIELTPYYRLLPIGSSNVLGLPSRNLNQWGFFLALRVFI